MSDYGSANFWNDIKTAAGPGSPAYAAPEVCYPNEHSPKMDTFSFGVLLAEMCLQKVPESLRMSRRTNPAYPVASHGASLEVAPVRGLLTIPA